MWVAFNVEKQINLKKGLKQIKSKYISKPNKLIKWNQYCAATLPKLNTGWLIFK